MKLPLTREDLLHNGKHPLVSDLYAQSRLAIDLSERLERADKLLSEAKIINSAFYQEWIDAYQDYLKSRDSLTQEGKRKEERK